MPTLVFFWSAVVTFFTCLPVAGQLPQTISHVVVTERTSNEDCFTPIKLCTAPDGVLDLTKSPDPRPTREMAKELGFGCHGFADGSNRKLHVLETSEGELIIVVDWWKNAQYKTQAQWVKVPLDEKFFERRYTIKLNTDGKFYELGLQFFSEHPTKDCIQAREEDSDFELAATDGFGPRFTDNIVLVKTADETGPLVDSEIEDRNTGRRFRIRAPWKAVAQNWSEEKQAYIWRFSVP